MTDQVNGGQQSYTAMAMAMGTGHSADMDGLAPIFPPQNFEVPDISYSNSVSPNADFNHSLFTRVQMFAAAHGSDMSGQQQQQAYFPPASNSPPGTSGSEDSDDLPLAQLAKRGLGPGVLTSSSVGSPSAANTDTTSLDSSPVSGIKKAKTAKKKKKKDPNEPQKPVSAYALFFRDTQATIKGHNPNASFGEVSKIVASMWDQLDPEHKDVYKKKTETAKKQYLKQLAAYRASQVSQSVAEESDGSLSPPSVITTLPSLTTPHPITSAQRVSSPVVQQSQQIVPHQMLQQQHFPQVMMGQSPSPPAQHNSSPVQQVYSSPPHSGPNSYQHSMLDNNMYGYTDPSAELKMTYPHCVHNGCGNYAKENASWDTEYCSNDCVISHCSPSHRTPSGDALSL